MSARLLTLLLLSVAVAGIAAADSPVPVPDVPALVPSMPAAPGPLPFPSPLPVPVPGLPGSGTVPVPGTGSGPAREAQPSPFPGAPDLVGPSGASLSVPIVLAFAGLSGLGLLAVWGGTRFREQDEVLAHEVRAAIYRHVQQHVGATLKDITDSLQLSTTNAVWHLRKLEDSGLVKGRKFNGAKVYYPTSGGVQARNLSFAGAALLSGNAKHILAFVQANPGVHQREVARLLGVNHGTVRWHLKKLRNAELLEERRLGSNATYHVSPLGAEALAHVAGRASPAPASPAPANPAAPDAAASGARA